MINIGIETFVQFIGKKDHIFLSSDEMMDSMYENVRKKAVANSALIKFGGTPWKVEKIYVVIKHEVFCIAKFLTDNPYYTLERVYEQLTYPQIKIG